ncbi:MAG: SDR family oxidoreductase [Candidatus Micrarchaeota archaeon]|nr:SDR family oxidoreductase [Candidatus Micrarchaeota archaeon]MDE1834236.1 SDR family oxidoreductase [Candidatus Micrarchaeota archaeon]MDE1859293.1 SDR family oxidoreductase [Candidatus Micrarchaeota archaeon]
MKTSGNTVLITGGSSGIGLALAEKFLKLGNTVIICARGGAGLDEAKNRLQAVHIRKCDISKENERKELCDWIAGSFPELNVLINNAGIQRKINLADIDELVKNDDEIEINLRSQIYLASRLVPLLSKRPEAAIVNVSSGLGFVPLAIFPVYCATKAAIHSFTLSLRYQLKNTPIKVFEVIPPTVYDTHLKGKPIEKTEWSVSAQEVASAVISGIEKDRYQIAVGPSEKWVNSSNSEKDQIFGSINH